MKDKKVDSLDIGGKLTQEIIEDAVLKSAMDMGPAQDIFHPDYGWVMIDGEITPEGVDFFKTVQEYYNKKADE